MTDEMWENGLREVMTGTAGTARVAAPPTDAILRKGRSSLRWRNGLTGSGVLGVVAAAVIAGTSLATGSGGGSVASDVAAAPGRLAPAADAVAIVGPASAKTKVVLYEDYRCPACKDVNTGLNSVLQADVANGKIQIEYRPTDLIDRNDAGTGSVAAGNAVLCAGEHGDFTAYRTALFANQPQETVDGFKAPALINLAKEIPGLVTAAFEKCVEDLPYAAAISRNFDTAINALHCTGMPCINADGQQWTGPVPQGQDPGTAVSNWLSQIIASH